MTTALIVLLVGIIIAQALCLAVIALVWDEGKQRDVKLDQLIIMIEAEIDRSKRVTQLELVKNAAPPPRVEPAFYNEIKL